MLISANSKENFPKNSKLFIKNENFRAKDGWKFRFNPKFLNLRYNNDYKNDYFDDYYQQNPNFYHRLPKIRRKFYLKRYRTTTTAITSTEKPKRKWYKAIAGISSIWLLAVVILVSFCFFLAGFVH